MGLKNIFFFWEKEVMPNYQSRHFDQCQNHQNLDTPFKACYIYMKFTITHTLKTGYRKGEKSANFFSCAHTRTCVAYSCSASTSFRPTAYMQHNFTCLPDPRFQVWPDHKIETLPVKIALRRSITQLVYVVDNLLTNWLFSYRFSVRMTNDGAKGKRNKRS